MCFKKYDPQWYYDSIDAVADSIDISIAYLNSVEKKLNEAQLIDIIKRVAPEIL